MQSDWRANPVKGSEADAQRARRTDLLDLNLLPARHRQRRLSLRDIAPALAGLGLLLLLLPVIDRIQEVNRSYQLIQSELTNQQLILEGRSELQQQVNRVETELELVRDELNGLMASYESFRLQDVAWNSSLSSVAAALPRASDLVRIDQSGPLVRVQGESAEYQLVLVYAERLAELPQVISVSIERIDRLSVPVATEGSDEAAPAETQPRFMFDFLLTMEDSNALESSQVEQTTPSAGVSE